jgi:D-proline reductase (dithiol) PrdB
MESVRYVEILNRRYASQGFPPYQWTVNTTAPLTRMKKPLRDCRVSMLTSGGVSRCSTAAWNPNAKNDLRLDEIAADAPTSDFQIHDSYYDHRDADRDLNCIFPLDRLRELEAEHVIGAVAPRMWSGFMGRIYTRSKVVNESAPALARELERDRVDLFLLVPS